MCKDVSLSSSRRSDTYIDSIWQSNPSLKEKRKSRLAVLEIHCISKCLVQLLACHSGATHIACVKLWHKWPWANSLAHYFRYPPDLNRMTLCISLAYTAHC